jgi:hypothetical protein
LEQKDDFRVARYIIDSGSSLDVETGVLVLKYLIVITGSAKTARESLGAGQSIMLSENETIVLENSEKMPLTVVEITLTRH